jgi:glutaredoxin
LPWSAFEEQRENMPGVIVTLYTKPGCHLCEDAKAAIAPLLKEFAATLQEVNIEENPEVFQRYRYDIPVLFIGSHKIAKHRVNPDQFRRQLAEAAANG